MSINDIRVNQDERFLFVILTDEKQLLYVTPDSEEAYKVHDEWCATHAAESTMIECYYTGPDLKGWSPVLPPNAPIDWSKIR